MSKVNNCFICVVNIRVVSTSIQELFMGTVLFQGIIYMLCKSCFFLIAQVFLLETKQQGCLWCVKLCPIFFEIFVIFALIFKGPSFSYPFQLPEIDSFPRTCCNQCLSFSPHPPLMYCLRLGCRSSNNFSRWLFAICGARHEKKHWANWNPSVN